jgi:hypothetical protein
MQHSNLQWISIALFFAILVVWIVAISNKAEHPWANNPWYPTMTAALLWGVWIERTKIY